MDCCLVCFHVLKPCKLSSTLSAYMPDITRWLLGSMCLFDMIGNVFLDIKNFPTFRTRILYGRNSRFLFQLFRMLPQLMLFHLESLIKLFPTKFTVSHI